MDLPNKRSLISITLLMLFSLINYLGLPGCSNVDDDDVVAATVADDDDDSAPSNEYIYSGQCSESTLFEQAGADFVSQQYFTSLDKEVTVEARDYLRCCDDGDGDDRTFICDVAYHFENAGYQQPATTLTATYPLLLGKIWLRPDDETDLATLSGLLAPLGVTIPLTLAEDPDSYELIPADYDPRTNPLDLAEDLIAIEQLRFSAFAVEDNNYETAMFENELILHFFSATDQDLAEGILADLGLTPDYDFTWGDNYLGSTTHQDSIKNNLQALALLRLIFNTGLVKTGKITFIDATDIRTE